MKNKLLILLAILVVSVCLLTSCSTYVAENEAISIAVNSFANYELYQGDELNLDDATITVTFNDGTTKEVEITSDMITGYNKNKVGPVTLTVSYKKLTTTVNVEVKALEIQRIAVNEAPEEIKVVQGGTLDLTGVSLKIYYQNKTSVLGTVTSAMVTGFSSELAPGEHTVYLNLSGFSAPLPITVVEKSIESIAVTTSPTINNYFVDEEFEPAGMAITITYNNESQEVVYYTSETKDDFEFRYDFSFALTSSPITVTYLGKYSTVYYLVVASPVCTNLEFSYSEAVFNEVTEESTMKVFSYYPTSYGVYIEGERKAPNQITALVEGDRIDWSTGKARLTFDDGTKRLVSLSDNSIYVQAYNKDNKLVSYKDYTYDIPGNYILYVSYGNMSKLTPLYVTVKEKKAIKLMLHNVESVTKKIVAGELVDRVYFDGEKVITDLVRYNVLYDNGTYLCDYQDTNEWAEVTIDMLDENSDFTVDYAHSVNATQRIGLEMEGVKATIEVKVQDISVVSKNCVLTPPAQNYVLKGSSQSLVGGTIYVEYSNGTYQMVDIDSTMVTYYNADGDVVLGFATAGEYSGRVYYEGFTGYYYFTVKNVVVESITITNAPSGIMEFDNYEAINFDGIKLAVVYSDPDASLIDSENYPAEVDLKKSMLYSYDKYNTGYQEVTFRYGGKVTNTFPIKIKGRVETYIEKKQAPNKVVYKVGEAFDSTGLVINKHFSDGTFVDVSDFTSDNWIIEPESNDSVGKKQVAITYKNNSGEVVGETIYLNYEVIIGEVLSISVSDEQDGFTSIKLTPEEKEIHSATLIADGYDTSADVNLKVFKITKNESLNTTGLLLHVEYVEESTPGTHYSENIKLESAYVNYDKTLNTGSSMRKLTVTYGGKTTQFWVYVIERELVSIEVITLPTIKVYADGQDLKLRGGEIKRSFNDGSADVLPMQNGLVTHDYNTNYFETYVSNDRYVVQTVTVYYGGCSAQMEITTYRRTTADDIITYSDTVSFYGNVKTPIVSLSTGIENFVAPEVAKYYKVNNAWVTERPSVPGSYPIRVIVEDNEYYVGSVIENQKMVIIEKIIEVRAHDAQKTYGEDDPELTYEIEGDGVDTNGNYINTVLVWNMVDGERVQDRIEIKLVRQEGENVIFDEATGTVKSYRIGYVLVNGDNQNNRYRIDFKAGEFKIERIDTEAVLYSVNKFVADGNPKPISVQIQHNGTKVLVAESDIIYFKKVSGDKYEKLDGAPSEVGEYQVRLSNNYHIVVGDSSCDYSIVES